MWLFFPLAAADQNLGVRSWANASGQVAWTRLDFAFGPDLTLLLYLVPNVPLQYSCLRIPWTEEPGGLQSTGSQRV